MSHFTIWANTIQLTELGYTGNEHTCGVFSEWQWWKESNCYNSGGEESREGVWMHANVYTYGMQAQMHTRSSITPTIHHVVENKRKRGVREK